MLMIEERIKTQARDHGVDKISVTYFQINFQHKQK